jgi:hypothetical protein
VAFGLFDELTASPTEPMPKVFAEARERDARAHLEYLATGDDPTRYHWKVCAMVANIIEVMGELGMVQDTAGLLQDAQQVLKDSADYAIAHGVPPRLVGPEVRAIEVLIDAYADVMEALPHRDFIRAVRETDKRLRGTKRPDDYDANPAKRRKR